MLRLIRIALILLLLPPLLAAVAGWITGPSYLRPIRRELTPDLVREADASFAVTHAHREEFDVRGPDGVLLRGWKVTPPVHNGSWVLLFTAWPTIAWASSANPNFCCARATAW